MKKHIVIFLFVVSSILAADELRISYTSGDDIYAVIRNAAGQAFDTTSNAFETWNVITDYDIALTDHSGDYHSGNIDAGLSSGRYYVQYWREDGAAPDETLDTVIETREQIFSSGPTEEFIIDTAGQVDSELTGDSFAIVNHADYGNDQLVRSFTPANTLRVTSDGDANSNVQRWSTITVTTTGGFPSTTPVFIANDTITTMSIQDGAITDAKIATIGVNLLEVNSNTAPITNWEATYDGGGYTDDNAPAKQIQVAGIGNIGAATNEFAILSPNGFTINNGLNEVNTEDVTHADNGTLHSLDNDGANILDCYYIFDIGGAFTPTNIVWRGRVFGNNDDLTVSVNTATIASPVWAERSLVEGSNSTTLVSHTFALATNDVMTGSDAGKVALRFNGTGLSSATLFTDQIICQKTPKTDNTGYSGGQIWYNSGASNENTVPDVDGTARNPVSTWAAALTLSGSLNITDFHIINGSTVQLTDDSSNFSLFGDNWTLDLNGQIIANAHFSGASNVINASTGTGYDFHDCSIMDTSFEAGDFINCVFSGDVTLTAAGTYLFKECASHVAGITTPSFDLENANENKELNLRGWKGGVEFKNFGHGTAVHTVSMDGVGQYILDVTCANADAGDVFAVRGNIKDNDEVVGGWDGTISDEARYDVGQIDATITANTIILDIPNTTEFEARTIIDTAYFDPSTDPVEILATGGTAGKNAQELVDDTWDEVISKADHNVAQSAAKALRQADISITSDTAQGPGTGNNQIQLATGASSTDGAYDPARVFIKDGLGAGQSRNILQYDGSSRTATVDRNWKTNPDNTSEYVIMSDAGREHVNEGLAQDGTLGSIKLNTLASSADDAYKNQLVFIRSGIGEDQVRRINTYNGTTKIATVSEDWDITPNTTSGYVIIPFACVEVQAIKNQELSDKSGTNFDTFFNASGATTTTEVDDIDAIAAELNKVPKSDGSSTWNSTALASIQTEADDAIVANHLDHIFKTDYDPTAQPGSATALFNELIESDAGVSRYTANALEQAPSGGGGGDATLANQVLILEDLVDIKGTGFVKDTHSLINLYTLAVWAQDWLEADTKIDDTNPAQFQNLRTKKQAGGGGAEISRKDYNDIDGNAITNLTTVFAEEVEPD